MDENVSRVSELVLRLINHMFPPNTNETVVQRYHAYFLRILSSRMGANVIEDESMLKTLLQKRIQKRADAENINKHTTNALMLRMQELMQRLNKNKVLNQKWSIYYLLYKISDSSDSKQGISVSAMETIFKAKDIEKFKQKQQDKSMNKSNINMDIENGSTLSTTVHTKNQVTFRNQKEESQTTTAKLVQKIANKGNPSIDLSETDLLRDILFAFQGIDGNYISFSRHEDSFVIKPTVTLPDPVKKMVGQLCEMGWLFKKVINFLQDDTDRGLTYQSLSYAIKEELNEYYRLIAILENLREGEDEQSRSSFLVEEDQATKSLSLRKLYLWSIEPFERLKWMSILCDACKGARGSVLISIVHTYAKQGSPSIQVLINRILKQVLSPLSSFIKQWVYYGELNDPYGEFFVSLNSHVKDENLWQDKYSLDASMIPGFMDQQLAEKILLTGKSVNFMRRCCGVNDWMLDIEFIDIASAVVSNFNQISKFTEFKDWVSRATEITSKKLLQVLFEKFRLSTHLEAIKRFLLFGQGDFIQYLMDTLNNELSKPASQIYRHNLLSLLETAVRASNAQYIDMEFLQRVDIKLLDASSGDNGWDIFSLNYRVDPPITTILSPKMMTGYLRLFNFLWRVKRVEHSLSGIWMQHIKGAHMIDRMKEFRSHMHKCNILRHEMIHFLSNFLNYIMIEVIESAWKTFIDEVRDASDLNEIIKYHEGFLNKILDKALLTPKSEKVYRQIIKIFELIFRFKFTQETLLTAAQEEYQRKIAKKNKENMMELLGEEDESYQSEMNTRIESASNMMTAETINHLQNIWKDYKDTFNDFMHLLKDEELSSKLRFLTFRLDFNEYYTNNPKNLKMQDIEAFKRKPFSGGPGTDSFMPSMGGSNLRAGRPGLQSLLQSRNEDKILPEEYKTREFNDSFQDNIETEGDKIIEEKRPSSTISSTSNNPMSRLIGLSGLSNIGGIRSQDKDASDLADIKQKLQMLSKIPTSRPSDSTSYQIPRDISSITGGNRADEEDDDGEEF